MKPRRLHCSHRRRSTVSRDDEDEDETPEPNTYWVRQDELLHTIRLSDVEEALEQRQEAVLAALRPQKKARK